MMPVICISVRTSMPNQISIGKYYMIDQSSIWIDGDGDAYGDVYENGSKIGQMLLSHFKSV